MTNTTTPTNSSVLIVGAFKALAEKGAAFESTTSKIMGGLVDSGVTVDSIKGDGDTYPYFLEGVARGVLTPKQYITFADDSLASKVSGKLTARGELKARVASRASKVRAMYAKHVAEPKTRGAKDRKTFDQIVAKQVDAWVKRITDNKDKDGFNCVCDPIELRAALIQVQKVLK